VRKYFLRMACAGLCLVMLAGCSSADNVVTEDSNDVESVFLDAVVVEEVVDIPEEIQELAELRWQSKQAKDWTKADEYRKIITDKGYAILDSKDGYKIEKL